MNRTPHATLLLAAMTCLACHQSPGTDTGMDGGTPQPGGGGGPAVHGTAIDTYVTDQGDVTRPRDLSGVAIAALVPGQGGAFQTYPGQGHADGTFTIPQVPAGTYYLQFGAAYYITASRTPDLGQSVLGRPDLKAPGKGTTLALDLSGLSRWGDNDIVDLYSSNGGSYVDDVAAAATPDNGATSLSLDVDYAQVANPGHLIDGAKGDQAVIYQLTSMTSDHGLPYLGIVTYGVAPSFTLADGQDTKVSATLAKVNSDQSAQFTLRRTLWQGIGMATAAHAKDPSLTVGMSAQPGAAAHGSFSEGPDLLILDPTDAMGDADTGKMSYADPFPASWVPTVYAAVDASLGYQAPGAASAATVGTRASLLVPLDAINGKPLAPQLGPVSAPLVAGKDATASASGVGLTPVIAWTPPAMGQATLYTVIIERLYAEAVNMKQVSRFARVLTATTAAASLQVPPGVLKAGETYFARITATASPVPDPDSHPLRQGLPASSADYLTGTFSP